MENFKDLISENLISILDTMNIKTPTVAQAEIIPLVKNSGDYIFISKTGSGKTFAYLLPLTDMLDTNIKTPEILILAPTSELCGQIYKEAKKLQVSSCLLVGGNSIKNQIEALKNKPKIIVGTWSRILELADMKKLKMHTISTIVLDEGDRLMVDENFVGTNNVIKKTLRDRKILYFSATINDNSLEKLKEIMKEPTEVYIDKEKIPTSISHYYCNVERRKKFELIRKIIIGHNFKRTIIFVNNPHTITDIMEKLQYHKLNATALFGSKNKTIRKKAIDQFNEGKCEILVTSDLTSRGIHFDNVECVMHFDIPKDISTYQHRSGRTGRNSEGVSIILNSHSDSKRIEIIEKRFKIKITESKIYEGKIF